MTGAEIAATADEMSALGRRAAAGAQAGMVVALAGGLGAGKTHWTKGFVAGLDCAAEVSSPTFPLVHEYPGGRLRVYHFDFYRLEHDGEILALGWDEYLEDDAAVVVVEWADKFPGLLPLHTRWLRFTVLPDGSRRIEADG